VQHTYTNGLLTGVTGFGTVSYHPNGMIHQVQHTNGATDTQANDPNALRRPASITTTFGGANRWSTGTYSYDGAGNVTKMGATTWFLYDKVSRLVTGNLDLAPTGTGTQRQQTYTFDPFGNLTTIGGASGRTTPTNPETNRLSGAVSYDAAGNLTVWNGATYEYDPFHQMSHMVSGAEDWRYAYTADGERVWMFKVGANQSRWTLRGLNGEILREYVNEGGQWRTDRDYVYRDGLLLAAEGAQGRRHFHLDHLGTPRLITNRAGWGDSYHVYYPFGEEATAFNQDTDRMKFTGHERDLASLAGAGDDLDSMHARHCSPITGRFLSVDPALESADPGAPQTWNRYAYVAGNPINAIDPSGEALFWIGPANAQRQVEQVANDTLHGVDLVIDGNGMASLVPNSETGLATPEQQALQNTLASAISRPEIVRLNLTSGSRSVMFGQYISGNLDIGDIAAAGKGSGVNDGALLAHEVREQEVKQVGGLLNDTAGYAQAHIPAVAAQEAVSGFQKISSVRNLNSQNTGTVVGVHARGTSRVTVTFQFVNGNLVRVTRR
jgi:RHS repeat-associated protein